jgi:hypothetical protein
MGGQSAVQLKKLRHEFHGPGHWLVWGFRRKFGGVHPKLAILELDTEPSCGGPLPALFSILPGKVDKSYTHTSGKRVSQYKLEHHTHCYRTDGGIP